MRAWVKALNSLGVCFVYRVKNTGTYDAKRGVFRRDKGADFVAIPDVCGYRTRGERTAIFIEAKYREGVEQMKKLTFSNTITDDQKKFLLDAHRAGHLAGVAYTLDDAIAIVMNDPTRYVRHPRTWMFLPDEEMPAVIEIYHAQKKALSRLKQDPVASATFLARRHDFDE